MRFGDLSIYAKKKLLDHLSGKTSFTMPTMYLMLSSTDPKVSITEPSGGDYDRIQTAGTDWNPTNDNGVLSNVNELAFPTPSASWGANGYWGAADSDAGGNLLASGRLGKVVTKLNEQVDESETTITVNDASGMPSTGTIIVEDEEITYAGVSGNDLTGCTRGAAGTGAKAHAGGHEVFLAIPKTIGIGDTVRWAAGQFKLRLSYTTETTTTSTTTTTTTTT